MRVARIEHEQTGGGSAVAEAYAHGLHKLMAYKDEYEVARLHLLAAEDARRDAEFGPGAKVQIMLQPPLLRAMGLERKVKLGRWAFPALGALRRARRLRGTALDPFGHARVRRVERALIGEYRELVDGALEHLTPATAEQVAAIAALPDLVRGYEDIKLAGVERFRARGRGLTAALEQADGAAGTGRPSLVAGAQPRLSCSGRAQRLFLAYAFAWAADRSTRSPSAMLPSSRCRPQVASGTGLSTGAPARGLACSERAPPADEQRAENAPRYSTYVVGGAGTVKPTSVLPSPIEVVVGNGLLGSTVVSLAAPPLSAPGLLHSTCRPLPEPWPNTLAKRAAGAAEDARPRAASGCRSRTRPRSRSAWPTGTPARCGTSRRGRCPS